MYFLLVSLFGIRACYTVWSDSLKFCNLSDYFYDLSVDKICNICFSMLSPCE